MEDNSQNIQYEVADTQVTLKNKLRSRMILILSIILAAAYSVYSFALIPLRVSLGMNIVYMDTVLPRIIEIVYTLLDAVAVQLSFSFIIFSIFRFGTRKSIPLMVIAAIGIIYKYLANLLITWFNNGVGSKSEIQNDISMILIYIGLELLLIVPIIIISHYKSKHAEHKFTMPFHKLISFGNPMQLTAFISAIIVAVARVSSRLVSDIIYGAPESVAEVFVIVGAYLSDIVIGIVMYVFTILIFIGLNSMRINMKLKKCLGTVNSFSQIHNSEE